MNPTIPSNSHSSGVSIIAIAALIICLTICGLFVAVSILTAPRHDVGYAPLSVLRWEDVPGMRP